VDLTAAVAVISGVEVGSGVDVSVGKGVNVGSGVFVGTEVAVGAASPGMAPQAVTKNMDKIKAANGNRFIYFLSLSYFQWFVSNPCKC
jgi:hypothetical protein